MIYIVWILFVISIVASIIITTTIERRAKRLEKEGKIFRNKLINDEKNLE
jgi:hypothetical protein